MAEYTDLGCSSNAHANQVLTYLLAEIADDEDAPKITAYVEKSTLRITYHDIDRDSKERQAWDWMLMGYRDGIERVDELKAALEAVRDSVGIKDDCSHCHVAIATEALSPQSSEHD